MGGTRHGSPGQDDASPPRLGFELWRHAVFSADDLTRAELSGALADADHDGAATLLEFAPGTDPLDPASLPRLDVELQGDALSVTFTRARATAGTLGVTLQAETSPDCLTWSPSPAAFEPLSSTETTETLRLLLDRPGTPANFLRLRVTRDF